MEEEKRMLVPFDSWAYLKARSRKERVGRDTSQALLHTMWGGLAKEDGMVWLNSRSLGGMENGEITSWSIEDLQRLLDEQNLIYLVR